MAEGICAASMRGASTLLSSSRSMRGGTAVQFHSTGLRLPTAAPLRTSVRAATQSTGPGGSGTRYIGGKRVCIRCLWPFSPLSASSCHVSNFLRRQHTQLFCSIDAGFACWQEVAQFFVRHQHIRVQICSHNWEYRGSMHHMVLEVGITSYLRYASHWCI